MGRQGKLLEWNDEQKIQCLCSFMLYAVFTWLSKYAGRLCVLVKQDFFSQKTPGLFNVMLPCEHNLKIVTSKPSWAFWWAIVQNKTFFPGVSYYRIKSTLESKILCICEHKITQNQHSILRIHNFFLPWNIACMSHQYQEEEKMFSFLN